MFCKNKWVFFVLIYGFSCVLYYFIDARISLTGVHLNFVYYSFLICAIALIISFILSLMLSLIISIFAKTTIFLLAKLKRNSAEQLHTKARAVFPAIWTLWTVFSYIIVFAAYVFTIWY
jgi:hypothetical protein